MAPTTTGITIQTSRSLIGRSRRTWMTSSNASFPETGHARTTSWDNRALSLLALAQRMMACVRMSRDKSAAGPAWDHKPLISVWVGNNAWRMMLTDVLAAWVTAVCRTQFSPLAYLYSVPCFTEEAFLLVIHVRWRRPIVEVEDCHPSLGPLV